MRAVHSSCLLAGIVASTVLGLAASAPAAYLQLTQERVLTANASASSPGSPVADDPKTETSTALGSFDRSFTSTAASPRANFPGEFARANASASQAVTLGGSSIDGQLQVGGFTGQLAQIETAASTVSSRWTSQITVDQASPFRLTGHMTMTSGGLGSVGTSSVVFGFSGTGEGENFVGQGGTAADRPIEASGVLQPGHVYTFTAQLDAQKVGDSFAKDVSGNINFTLALPEPASAAGLLMIGLASLRRRRVLSFTA